MDALQVDGAQTKQLLEIVPQVSQEQIASNERSKC